MAYRIRRKDRSVEVAVRRIAREQLVKALDAIEHASLSPDAIHSVRLRCKKIRALLRLVRPCFDRFGAEDARLRDTARLLAPARDTEVLQKLAASLLQSASQGKVEELLKALPARPDHDEAELDMAALVSNCRELLQGAHDDAKHWQLSAHGWDAAEGGLKRTYRSAREKLGEFCEEPSGDNLHALRRHAKYHLFHTTLLVRLEPETMRRRIGSADRLCELLGDDHDLGILTQRLSFARLGEEHRPLAQVLLTLGRRRQALNRPRAVQLAKELLVESPQELAAHWGKRWKKWR